MRQFKLLMVEDDPEFVKHSHLLREEYEAEFPICFVVDDVTSLADAMAIIQEKEFDGAVVDLKLSSDRVDGTFEGNEIIEQFTAMVRCPVIVFSANHMNLSDGARQHVFDVIPRDQGFEKVLRQFHLIQQSGLTEIMASDGMIEGYLNQIYWDVVAKRIKTWMGYAESGQETRDAMLRHILGHLVELIGQDASCHYPDEAYLHVFDNKKLKTGQLFNCRESSNPYIVISPACDLATGKSDYVQFCRIYQHNEDPLASCIFAVKEAQNAVSIAEDLEAKDKAERKLASVSSKLYNFTSSKPADYLHYIPKRDDFDGGVINFRDIRSIKKGDFMEKFIPLGIQISSPFLKDIVGRFASYYARQGAPNFEINCLRKQLI